MHSDMIVLGRGDWAVAGPAPADREMIPWLSRALSVPRGAWLALAAVAAVCGLIALVLGAGITHSRMGFDAAIAVRNPAAAARINAPLPAIRPVSYLALSPGEARQLNASIPFAAIANPPARAWVFAGTADDRERAATCLASTAYYEAGDDEIGGRAVIQVVLNRLRHPAFPKNVCGVVFEGSERRTGCQFTFTCDGALARRPQPEAWARARALADQALSGAVYAPVGNATHYHTDWVVPNWSPEMDKVVEVHTHLFFRWRGGWGRPEAFRRAYAGPEILDERIRDLAHLPADVAAGAADAATVAAPLIAPKPVITGVSDSDLRGNAVRLVDEGRGEYLVALDPAAYPGSYAVMAWKICENKARCRVLGWRNPLDVPATLPLQEGWSSTLSFVFEKGADGTFAARWNCGEMKRENRAQCLADGRGGMAASRAAPEQG